VSTATAALLSNRPYAVLLSLRTLAMFGFSFAPVALAFGVLGLPGGDASMLAVVLAAQLVPEVVLLLIGGVVADRYPRARVLQLGQFVCATGWFGLGAMLLTGVTALPLLCATAALTGVAAAVINPALTGIIPELVPPELLQQGNAWLAMGANAARLAGLVAGGAVVTFIGGGWAVTISGALYLVAGVLSLWLPHKPAPANPEDTMVRQLIDGWDEFRSRQWLWVVVAQYAILVMMLQAAHGVLGPVIAKSELGGPAAWTAVLAGEAAGAIVGVAVALVWRPHRPILVGVIVSGFAGFPAILLGVSGPLPVIVAAALVMGAAFELFGVLWLTTMQAEVPPAALARVSSYDAFGSMVLGPLGLVIAAPAAAHFGVHNSLVVCGIIASGMTLAALAFPEVRRLRARPVAAKPG